MTVRQWLETWLDAVRSEISPKAHERYSEIARCCLIPAVGQVQLAKLVPIQIQNAYSTWATSGRRDGKLGGLSPLTRRYIHVILKSALARAVEQQLLARNPADAFKKRLPKVERKEIATLTMDQSAYLLDSIRHMHIYWPELCRLKRQQAEALLRLGVRQSEETLVCCREDGEPKQPRSLTHEFAHVIGKIVDLPRVRFHDLRHSHATQLLASGVHPKVAQKRLGHSTITTTIDLYSHVTDTMQSDAVARLTRRFGL